MDHLKDLIRTIPDFPQPGISFRDLTTLFLDPAGFKRTIQALADQYRNEEIDMVVGVESRGFILAAPLTMERNLYITKSRPWMPHRSCLKNAGPLDVSLIAGDSARSTEAGRC